MEGVAGEDASPRRGAFTFIGGRYLTLCDVCGGGSGSQVRHEVPTTQKKTGELHTRAIINDELLAVR